MAKTLRITSVSAGLAANTTYYFNGVGLFNAQTSDNETFAKSPCRPYGGTYSKLTVRTISSTYSTGSSTFKLRKNGADVNQSVSVPYDSSGTFTDSTNTDSFAAGDEISLSVVTGGTGAETQVFRFVTLEFDSDTNTVSQIGGSGGTNFALASVTRYLHFTGLLNNDVTFEQRAQLPFRSSATAKNFQARITTNARTTATTFDTRKNAVVGNMTFSVGSTQTGLFEDTTNTDSIVSGDLYNARLVTGTGTQTLTVTGVYVSIENTNSVSHLLTASNNVSNTFATTYYPIFAGNPITNTSESVAQMPLSSSGTLQNMACRVATNSLNGASTLYVGKNGSDTTITASISGGTTGTVFDITHTENVTAGSDLINPKLVTGGTSGLLILGLVSLEFVVSTPTPSFFSKTVSVLSNAGTGTQDITYGESWTPKVAIVSWSRANTSADTFQEHASYGIGFTDGTNQRCVVTASEDNQARGDTGNTQVNNALIRPVGPSAPTTVDAEATFTQWLSNGMQITWSDAPAAQFYINVLFLGGDDITNLDVGTLMSGTGTGDISVTDKAYQADFGMFLTGGTTTENSSTNNGGLSIGAATSSSAQWVQSIYALDNPVTMSTRQYYNHSNVVVTHDTAVTGLASFSSFNSNGFTLTISDAFPASIPIYYLIIKGGSFAVGNATEPASVQQQTITTNKDTKGVMIFGLDTGTANSPQNGCMQTIGMGSSSSNQGCEVFEDTNGTADSVVVSRHDTNQIYLNITANVTATSSTLDDEAALFSVSDTGFVLDWTNVGQARPFRFISFGIGVTLTEVVKQTTTLFNIIQEVTKSVTVKSNIYQEVPKSVTAKFDVYEETAKQTTIKYDIAQEVQKQLTILFDIQGLVDVIKQTTILYDILQEVPKQVTTKYDVYQEVTKSNTILFNIYQEVVKQVTVLADIYQEISKQVTTKSDIYEEVAKQTTTKFDVYEETAKTTTIKFDILQEVIKQLTTIFDILVIGFIDVVKSTTVKFDVYQEVEKSVTLKYDILQQVEKQLTLLHDILQEIPKQTTIKFDILQEVTKQVQMLFDILVIGYVDVIKTTTMKFDIAQEVEKQTTVKFDILQDVVKQLTLLSDIYQEVPKQITAKFDILQDVAKSTTVKFDIIQEVTKQLIVLFDIYEQGLVTVTKSLTTLYNIAQEVPKSVTAKFDVYQNVEKATSIKFDILQEIAKNVSVKFDILQEVMKTNSMLFDILQEVDKTTTVKFDVFESVEKQVTALYDIVEEIEKQVTTVFDIYSIIPTVEVEKSTTVKFDIHQEVAKTTAIKFAIVQEVVKQLRTLFGIKGKDFIDSDFGVQSNRQKDLFGPHDHTWNLSDHRSKIFYDKKKKSWRIGKA